MNPYADALNGLVLDDPVAAFFDFCRAREAVRERRRAGEPPPWTDDPILQKGRFLNVFREDDRGSQALLAFAASVADDLPALVHALFFARWCNRASTLDALSPVALADPDALRSTLPGLHEQPWCNVTAYPVEPVRWQGTSYSRLDTATTLFAELAEPITEAILAAGRDVVRATAAVNGMLGMDNDFPIFMAVMDLAWFRPDLVDPASDVPTGIGAAAYMDRLQAHLGARDHHETARRMVALAADRWPDARRPLQPIDIEFLCCECRKYWSYVNGTKSFTGKNVFVPGESARLLFDLDRDPPTATVQTGVCVLAGGPGAGKTTLLRALERAGHEVLAETAEVRLRQAVEAGGKAEDVRADPVAWQRAILHADLELFDGLAADGVVFTDTSVIEDVVFARRAGLQIGPRLQTWLQRRRYAKVFFLEPLAAYQRTDVRLESRRLAERISAAVQACYREFGYEPVVIPAGPVAERVDTVLRQL